VSALDRSVAAQVLNLLLELRLRLGLTYLLVSHDLDVVNAVADRVLTLREGRVVSEVTPA
jgi:peptide/nickel transport system ATP-binding protein